MATPTTGTLHDSATGDGTGRGLQAHALTKYLGGTAVLEDFSLSIAPGEVHGLVGENGSGKSTFIKILSGYHIPEPGGVVLVDGAPVRLGSPASSYELGCRFVHQDLGLIETSTVMDNLNFSKGFATRLGTIRRATLRREAAQDLARIGLELDPSLDVGSLSAASRTGVAIARALGDDPQFPAKVLVLDEPTAALPITEVRRLLEMIKTAAESGVAVLYVTHRIDELFRIADNVSVLKDGKKVATRPISRLTRASLITLLVGSELEEVQRASRTLSSEQGAPIMEVRELASGPLRSLSLSVRSGDLVGIAGVTGSGRDVALRAIFGSEARDGGEIFVNGEPLAPGRPDLAMKAGIASLPPDRKVLGCFRTLTAGENLVIADLQGIWRPPFLRRSTELSETRHWFQRFDVRPVDGINRPFATFSGGNQQKILFAKWLRRRPQILLLDEPTNGVDLGAKASLHQEVLRAAEAGAAVIISSSDVDELVAICHRVIIFRQGRVAAELSGDSVTVSKVTAECLGIDEERFVAVTARQDGADQSRDKARDVVVKREG